MATARYSDYILRHPDSTAPEDTVEAFIGDAAAEISARCAERGTSYEELVEARAALVKKVECDAAYRRCGRAKVDKVSQDGLSSFTKTVGDHTWSYGYTGSNGNTSLLESDWRALGLSGQQMGWLRWQRP